jgi:hypothetical protein
MKRLRPFDKYAHYYDSVQDIDRSLKFFEKAYRKHIGSAARVFREDFCGTFALSCGWIKRHPKNSAIAVDLDPEPIRYGKKHYLPALSKTEQKKLDIRMSDVLNKSLPGADLIGAVNFSYYIFKERKQLLTYFSNCREKLSNRGMFLIDAFGGTETTEPNVDETKFRTYTYFWDQDNFDPINNQSRFYIHYKRKGERKRERVFGYDWRMWTVPELRDILHDAGFRKTVVYWEGTNAKGNGTGNFHPKEKEIHCSAWVAYIVALK